MRATPPVRFLLSRTLFFGWAFCLLFLTACQTTSLTLDPMLARRVAPPDGAVSQKDPAPSAVQGGAAPVVSKPAPQPVVAGGNGVLAEVTSILDGRGKSKISPEALLEAEGNMNIVEQSQDYDPAAEHLKARSNVDTSRKTKVAGLTPHFDPDVEEQKDKTFRVLKIQKGDLREDSVQTAAAIAALSADVEDIPVRNRDVVAAPVVGTSTVSLPEAAREVQEAALSGDRDMGQDTGSGVESALVIVPGRKPQVQPSAIMMAQAAGKAVPVVPRKKPDAMPHSGQEIQDHVAQIEPAAGAAQGDVVLPGQKPVRPAALARENIPGKDVAVPANMRPKTAFMPVKLQSLGGETDVGLPASGSQGVQIIGLRSGEHEGRSRVVLEVRGDAQFEARLDNGRRVLSVDIEGARWAAGEGAVFHSQSVVKDFKVESLPGGGTKLLLDLKKETKLLAATSLGKDKAGVTRIVVDLRNE